VNLSETHTFHKKEEQENDDKPSLAPGGVNVELTPAHSDGHEMQRGREAEKTGEVSGDIESSELQTKMQELALQVADRDAEK